MDPSNRYLLDPAPVFRSIFFIKIILINNQCSLRPDGTCIISHRNLLTITIPSLSRIRNHLPPTPTTNLPGLVSTTSTRIHRFIGFREDVQTRKIPSSTRFVVFRKRNGVVTRSTRVRPRDERPARRKYEEGIRGGMHGRRKRNRRDASPITDFLPGYKIHLTSRESCSLSRS